ncbi:pro-neuregulin-1, membrane-bound isoform isoform X2 [Acipenser ruthenus]|uniref:pro-neuregulin-1, membrane-bound isoform isoform X2 n=1 Tax=Acipenser ruthenus TaxID=7906 RepID=UPI002741AA85|nr:pro-neuregulin-1, membrane-bound isoform isoform X2 [Acipenser ruthenus]
MRARPAAQNRPYFSPFNISTVSGFVLLFAFSLDGVLSKNLACDFSSTPATSSVQELAHRSGVIIEGKVQVEGLESDVNQEEREILLRERAEAKGKESQGEEMDGNEKTTQELLSNRTSFLEPYLLKVRVHQVWAVKAGGIKKNSIISLIVDFGSHCFTLKNDTRYIFFMQPTNDTSVFKAAFQPLEAGRKARKDVSRVLCQRCTAPKLKKVKSVEVEEGKKVVLKCEASEGNPRPVLTWYKDRKPLKGKNKPKDIKIKQKKTGNSSDIQIPKAKLSHAGTYTCEAANSQGIVQSAGNITVIPGPQATTPPTPPPTTTTTVPTIGTGHVIKCSDSEKNYCVNGGECFILNTIPSKTKYLCRCPNEFTGDRCQNYVMASFYKAEELYQKRVLTITGICIALLVVGIMCVVAYCKTKKQRKKLHDRLRQSLRSERNNMNNLANGPYHPNPPTESVQLVNQHASKNAIYADHIIEKETETSFSTSQYSSTTRHDTPVTQTSSHSWNNGKTESMTSESRSALVTSSMGTNGQTSPVGHRGRLNGTGCARDLTTYLKNARDSPESYKDSPHSERYVSAMTTPTRMSPVELQSPLSPPSEMSPPLSSLATSVPSMAISPLVEDERPLLLVTPPRVREKRNDHTNSNQQRNSAHYNHGHEAHSPPPSPLRIVEDDEYETTQEYEPAVQQPAKKVANGRRAKRTKLNGHIPHKLESDSDSSSESSSSESETEDERIGEDTPFLSIQNPMAANLESAPAFRLADGSRTNTTHQLSTQEDLQARLSSVIVNQDPIAV